MYAVDFLIAVLGYLIGSFPTGVVLSRTRYGIDVREMGSGNIGATNITRNFGWYAGVVTFFADFFKGFLPVAAARYFFPQSIWWQTILGTALVLGHCFSVYLKFRGGKGVATSLGCLLAATPTAGWIAALCYAVMLMLTRISAVGSLVGISAAVCFVVASRAENYIIVLTAAIAVIVVIRHRTNIARLFGDLKSRRRQNG